jgi:hypothetical protein
MSPLQIAILTDSVRAVKPIRPLKMILNVLISSAIVILIVSLTTGSFDWMIAVMVLVVTAFYMVFKDFLLRSRLQKTMREQCAYAYEKYPNTTLYVPAFDKTGLMIRIRDAGLLFTGDECSLITFQQLHLNRRPNDSIVVPLGNDFTLTTQDTDPNQLTIFYRSTLMGTTLVFGVLNTEVIQTKIRTVLANLPKEV